MSWHGSGLLSKPIGDLHTGTHNNSALTNGQGTFFSRLANKFRLRVHSIIISEPEEYALVFGLFALGFVFFHRQRRRMQRKRRQQAATTP